MPGFLLHGDKAILDAPSQLGAGEGFYDQEPFQTIVAQVSEAYHSPPEKVRTLITFLGKGRHWRAMPEADHPDHKRWMDERSMQVRANPIGQTLLTLLYQFLYWYEYIEDMHRVRLYANDGSFRPLDHVPSTFEGTPTYVHWVTGRLQLDQELERADLAEVLREAFPGYDEQPETMRSNTTGQRASSRIWVLKRAANLLPE